MARWLWAVLIVMIVSAILGFAGIFVMAAGFLKVIFWITLVLFLAGLFIGRRSAV